MIGATCQRKARHGIHLVYTGTNVAEIEEFTGYTANPHNGCIMMRNAKGQLQFTLHPGHVVMFGEDNVLRTMTREAFESKYDILTR